MIQELLGGAGLIGGERKVSINGASQPSSSLSPSPSPSLSPSSSSTTTTTPATSSSASENQNLRCPRCSSSNTKFCYYNNYNLTQPRHFCKTCRRYWTKGGALRNVPIGGGCRKNKSITVSTSVGKSSAGKLRSFSPEIGKSGLFGGFDQEISLNPVLWASPQNSHLLALLRSHQNPNPNSMSVKDERMVIGNSGTSVHIGGLNCRAALDSDPFNPVSSLGQTGPFWRTNQNHAQQLNGFALGDHHHQVQNTNIQELYQRLRSSASYYPDHTPVLLSNVASSSSPSFTTMGSAPAAASVDGELGHWDPTLEHLPTTTNGAFP